MSIKPPPWMSGCDIITDEEKARLASLTTSWPEFSINMQDGSIVFDDLLKIAWLEITGKRRGLIISRSISRWRKLRMYMECEELLECGAMPSRKLRKLLIND